MTPNFYSSRNDMRGYMIPIGGAEDQQNNTAILQRFVELCGAGDAHIAIIPTASKRRSTGPRYERVFSELGVGEVSIMTDVPADQSISITSP